MRISNRLVNTANVYGWISILLHLVGAIGVIWLYFLGESIEHAEALGLARDVRQQFVDYHISIGMIFLGPLAARVFWHFAHRQPRKPDQNVWLNRLSDLVIWGFLAMITVQIVTGPLIEWSAPRPLKIFDQTILPSPFSTRVEWLHDGGEFLHKRAPNLFWPLIALHIAGSLKHLLISRDGSFRRMLWAKPDDKEQD